MKKLFLCLSTLCTVAHISAADPRHTAQLTAANAGQELRNATQNGDIKRVTELLQVLIIKNNHPALIKEAMIGHKATVKRLLAFGAKKGNAEQAAHDAGHHKKELILFQYVAPDMSQLESSGPPIYYFTKVKTAAKR